MKIKKKHPKKPGKRHVVLSERDLSTIHAGKKAKKKATKKTLSEPIVSEFGIGGDGGGNI